MPLLRLTLPLVREQIVKLGAKPTDFAVDVAGLAVYGHYVESLSARLSLGKFRCDLIDVFAGNLPCCSRLTALSLDAMETDGSGLLLLQRLVSLLKAGVPQLRHLEILLPLTDDLPVTDEIAPILRYSPNLETLHLRTFGHPSEDRRAPQVPTLASLRELGIPNPRFLSSSTFVPALRRVVIGEVSSADLPLMHACFGSSLESLTVTVSWAPPPAGVRVSFPRLRTFSLISAFPNLKPPAGLLSDIFGPTTPLETLEYTALNDDIVSDVQRFVTRQPRTTLKGVTLAQEASDEVHEFLVLLFARQFIGSGRVEQALQDVLENRVRPRYRRFRAWAEQHGIEVVPLWLR